MNNQEEKLDEIREDLEETREDLEETRNELGRIKEQRLNYPLDPASQDIIRRAYQRFLPEDILDIAWNGYIHIFELLGSLKIDETVSQGNDSGGDTEEDVTVEHRGSWSTSSSGSGSFPRLGDRVRLSTGATSSSVASVFNTLAIQRMLRYDRVQRFRSAFQVNSVASITAYIVRGDTHTGDDYFYGFKIVNDTLKGVTKNNGSEVTVDLQTISASTVYDVEAKLLPANKVLFLVKDSDNPDYFESRGVITTELPTESNNVDLATFQVENQAAADKQLDVSFFEYIQKL